MTKKFLGKEDRYKKRMISKDVFDFILKKKISIDEKQIVYDEIELINLFSYESTRLNTKNILASGDMFTNVVEKDGKKVEFNMIYCEKGIFTMDEIDTNDHNSKREVIIKEPFLLGETMVTQELYELVMPYNPSFFKGEKYPNSSQRPVEQVTWYDAIKFCNTLSLLLGKNPYYKIKFYTYWDDDERIRTDVEINENANGFRLPLSKEWEYAAKDNTNNLYAGTNDVNKLEEYAWFLKNSDDETHPVKTKKPNEWGICDMIGNVYEWCYDGFETNDEKIRDYRIFRGGCWRNDVEYLGTDEYSSEVPYYADNESGFRIALSL